MSEPGDESMGAPALCRSSSLANWDVGRRSLPSSTVDAVPAHRQVGRDRSRTARGTAGKRGDQRRTWCGKRRWTAGAQHQAGFDFGLAMGDPHLGGGRRVQP